MSGLSTRSLEMPATLEQDEYETFFRYTSGRWLYNEEAQLAKRYTRFNVPALKTAAEAVMKSPCESITKLPEGLFNKVFLLKMRNGKEVIAKIPNPNAGVATKTVASEVAVLDLLRNTCNLPVPEVYGYSSSAKDNAVGVEYILMEKAPGKQLSEVWSTISQREKYQLAVNVAKFEATLAELSAEKYGSLYYAADGARYDGSQERIDIQSSTDVPKRFMIGETVRHRFWAGERANMDISRGPWNSALEYFVAIADREISWIQSHAPATDEAEAALSYLHIKLLKDFKSVLPFILPQQERTIAPVLWHTDLHDGNIFVDGEKPFNITSIIDWQGTTFEPFFCQARVPSIFECKWDYRWGMVIPPPLRPDINDLHEPERGEVLRKHYELSLKKRYEFASRTHNPRLIETLDVSRLDENHEIAMLFDIIGHSWTHGPVPLRHILTQVVENWSNITGAKGHDCPLNYTSEEIAESTVATEAWGEAFGSLEELRAQLVGKDGWVSHEDYDYAKAALESHRDALKELQANLKTAGGTTELFVV